MCVADRLGDIVQYVSSLFAKPRRINNPKGRQKIFMSASLRSAGRSAATRWVGSILHMIDFQKLLIGGGDFSTLECVIDAALPACNGTKPER